MHTTQLGKNIGIQSSALQYKHIYAICQCYLLKRSPKIRREVCCRLQLKQWGNEWVFFWLCGQTHHEHMHMLTHTNFFFLIGWKWTPHTEKWTCLVWGAFKSDSELFQLSFWTILPWKVKVFFFFSRNCTGNLKFLDYSSWIWHAFTNGLICHRTFQNC